MRINSNLNQFFLFIGVVLMQIFLFDKMLLFKHAIPFIYPLFIILQPPHGNRLKTLIFAFLVGLCVDFFHNTGGMHATASLVIAYIRPQLLHFNFGLSYDYKTLSINNAIFIKKLSYIFLVIFFHHFILFGLEIFNVELWELFLKKLLTSTLYSVTINIMILQLLQKRIN